LIDELDRSRRTLESALGTPPAAVSYPFGVVDGRVAAAAAECGYSIGFALTGRWCGDALRIPRSPVHCWSPELPVVGRLGQLERAVSAIASRCSVGTSLWQRSVVNGVRLLTHRSVAQQNDALGV
jgi:peptidoglycan/xylan/chitin deacetylase (PgdA/CDA1 family)